MLISDKRADKNTEMEKGCDAASANLSKLCKFLVFAHSFVCFVQFYVFLRNFESFFTHILCANFQARSLVSAIL